MPKNTLCTESPGHRGQRPKQRPASLVEETGLRRGVKAPLPKRDYLIEVGFFKSFQRRLSFVETYLARQIDSGIAP